MIYHKSASTSYAIKNMLLQTIVKQLFIEKNVWYDGGIQIPIPPKNLTNSSFLTKSCTLQNIVILVLSIVKGSVKPGNDLKHILRGVKFYRHRISPN